MGDDDWIMNVYSAMIYHVQSRNVYCIVLHKFQLYTAIAWLQIPDPIFVSLKYIKTEQHSDEMSDFGFKVLLRARLILKIDFFFSL